MEERQFTGTGFPCVFYLKYHLYRNYFPLYALARYRNVCTPQDETLAEFHPFMMGPEVSKQRIAQRPS